MAPAYIVDRRDEAVRVGVGASSSGHVYDIDARKRQKFPPSLCLDFLGKTCNVHPTSYTMLALGTACQGLDHAGDTCIHPILYTYNKPRTSKYKYYIAHTARISHFYTHYYTVQTAIYSNRVRILQT